MRLATLKIMRVINDKIYPRGKWMSFTNTTRQVVQFAFSAGRDSVAVLVWRGDRAVARISKSAVSRVSNPQTLRRLQSRGTGDGSADWKSAIQQVGNLRYVQRVLNRYRLPSRQLGGSLKTRPASASLRQKKLASAARFPQHRQGRFAGVSRSDMKAKIIITPRKAVVDPQGKAVQNALEHMGYSGINAVHVGKYLEIELNGADRETARKRLDEACHKFLSNPVIEDYKLEIE